MKRSMALAMAWAWAMAGAAAAERPAAAGQPAAAWRPNIVWLLSEDNSACWLRLYDPAGARLPVVERMAENGLVFNRAYSCAPICSVARSTLVSGCSPTRIGTQYHRPVLKAALPEGWKLFPAYLKAAGYYTSNNWKEDYNIAYDRPEVWDESGGKADYRHRRPGQPFFHMQTFLSTHEHCMHAKLTPAELADPALEGVRVFPNLPDTPTFRALTARYRKRVGELEGQLARVVNRLKADGLLDDTFIFYFGDNGGTLPGSKGYPSNDGLHVPLVVYVPKNGRHLVPAPAGSRINGRVSFLDFGPTVLALAGLPVPAHMDGRPFLGKGVSLKKLEARDEAFSAEQRFDGHYCFARTLHKGRFHYIRAYEPYYPPGMFTDYRYKQAGLPEWRALFRAGKLAGKPQERFFLPRPAEQLYDVAADRHESRDLAGLPEYRGVLLEMRAALRARAAAAPDTGFIPECELAARCPDGRFSAFAEKNAARFRAAAAAADLQLESFPAAKPKLLAALKDPDPWIRHWGAVDCCAFASALPGAAGELRGALRPLEGDPSPMVRIRALEFAGIAGDADAGERLVKMLAGCGEPAEAHLILHALVFLRDHRGIRFDPAGLRRVSPGLGKHDGIRRRLLYLRAAAGKKKK